MAAEYHKVELFGGAITASLPVNFADVSDIRQIPDNQEVYLDADGFTSIVVDILERVDQPDVEALKFHMKDITEGEGGSEGQDMKIWSSGDVIFPKLPPQTPASTLFATSPPGEKQRGRANEPDFVGILLFLIRLEQQKTDIVITINVPHVAGHYDKDEVDPQAGEQGHLVEQAFNYRMELLATFEIKDWNLFVQD